LGLITGIVCRYFDSASIILITKSAKIVKRTKICHSTCSGILDVAELYDSILINLLETEIFRRPVVIEGEEFYLFSKNRDPLTNFKTCEVIYMS